MAAACELAKAKGAKRAMPLTVAGAYHSPLMAGAQPKLRDGARASFPASARGARHFQRDGTTSRRARGNPSAPVEQVTSPRCGGRNRCVICSSQGFTRFIELGPGTALSGFMKRIDKNALMINISDSASLQNAVNVLNAPMS